MSTSSSNPKSVTTADSKEKAPTLLDADNLLRLHVINAHFTNEKEHQNTYAVVTVGKKCARTESRALAGPKDGVKNVAWDEHFSIEYESGDLDSYIHVEVFSKATLKDDLLGEFKLRLGDVDPPKSKDKDKKKKTAEEKKSDQGSKAEKDKKKEEPWATSAPKDAPLTDKKGAQVGTIVLRLRREVKLYGRLVVDLKEVDLNNPPEDVKSVKCLTKLTTQAHESPSSEGKKSGSLAHFVWKNCSMQFEVNQMNHVYDVFIEVWRDEPGVPIVTKTNEKKDDDQKNKQRDEDKKESTTAKLLGQARLTLFDTRSKFSQPLPIYTTTDHRLIGHVRVQAKIKQDKNGRQKAVKEETKKDEKGK